MQFNIYLITFQYPFLFVPILSMNPFLTRDANTLDTVLLDIPSSTTKVSYGMLGLLINSNKILFSLSANSSKRFLHYSIWLLPKMLLFKSLKWQKCKLKDINGQN